MFNFGNANENQRLAIETSDGPVLITAGPGTGKTYTLVQRAIYLIQERGVMPERIMMATFTEKAAKELITRITNELDARGIQVNINEMYIGTFHSLCLRIIKENLEYTRLKKNYRTLDAFDQSYTVFQNIKRFNSIDGIDLVLSNGGAWRNAGEICGLVNNLSEEMIEPSDLKADPDKQISALGSILETYKSVLAENNLMDFSAIQVEAYWLLINNPSVLSEIQSKIRYIMVDEYQDTNFIQEQIVFLLGNNHQNICVVGDDDQGLYRFRGATIRNILEFPSKFDKGVCKVIPLDVNYRSNSNIVDFYNTWMSTTDGARFRFRWRGFRFDKTIKPHVKSNLKSPAVVKLSSVEDVEEWYEKILGFITELKHSGKLTDYNQLAFLFNSVKHERVVGLANFLEKNGIQVYSPRSDMFFQREEIKLLIGCLMLMFPTYVLGLEQGKYDFIRPEHYNYFRSCIVRANEYLVKPESADFRNWIRHRGKIHTNLKGTTDYAYSGLIYQMFEFAPFSGIIDTDMTAGVVDVRPARNIALFTQVVGKFEYLHRIDVLSEKHINNNTEWFFNLYLKLLFDGGISEYEDDAEYAPSGCVSFMTIHQSKGMEFPIVFVDSLSNIPRKSYKDLLRTVEEKYFKRPAFEPHDDTKFFDFWRLYYTAFSRAQDLLILTCNEDKRTPSMYFSEIYGDLPSIDSEEFDLSEFNFKVVKDVNLKDAFSFTSHISVYETCSIQYKLFKELGFAPVRVSAMLFGMLVHQTIEDVHRAALRSEEHLITPDNITVWFDSNYTSLTKSERTYLAEPQRNAALKQVLRYAERQATHWNTIKEAEVNVSLVKPDYIIEGTIDLIKGEGDTVELVDFKSEKKPDMIKDVERLEHYRGQLQVYAHLVEKRTGQKVSKMHLYYTGEETGVPTITYPYQKSSVDATIAAFDDTVHKILRKEYKQKAASLKTCNECDFRFYCGK
ncbi:ATP-dependent DNA helicase [Clostridium sp. OS1-26]|uniref:ATP-dependent DNA helicase n=1 Tax=Clostridium sp. OS1-26 TaxID=3070681 RepID=UPI0027DF01D0|nr:ATP-dependent DNA helicase [Clostridium sp. OS1-26]WML36945.1 ATP-dependent DNA helicase [Clostridium sp. OS1-26]